MENFSLDKLLRANIRQLQPYSSARHEFSGEASIFLDANENSIGSPTDVLYNRYPDPNQTALKQAIARIKGLDVGQIFLGNGSDEAIDLLFRMFCEPALDSALICPPTYGMYEVSAAINDAPLIKVPLKPDYTLNVPEILRHVLPRTRLLFICSPNNPTGNSMSVNDIRFLLNKFKGIVVVDEAYIDFSPHPSWVTELKNYPNLVVLQTFSKAWGMAGLRVGMAFASPEIISVMNRVKAPYNLSEAVQQLVLKALERKDSVERQVKLLVEQRSVLADKLEQLDCVQFVYPSDANFLLVRTKDANRLYNYLVEAGIVVRNRSNIALCENCLRITVGTPEENEVLLAKMKEFK